MGLFYWLVGRLLYRFGFRKIGFRMVAMSIAGDFGTCKGVRKWLVNNCPFGDGYCKDCRLWTCPGIEKLIDTGIGEAKGKRN